jgi:hypothetical protein
MGLRFDPIALALLIVAARPAAPVTITAPAHDVRPGATAIIMPLTDESRDEAITCGRAGEECAVAPYRLCPAVSRRYAARIATPFSRVALSVLEALKGRRRPNPMMTAVANGWGVGIYVFPADDSSAADAIRRVELHRKGTVIQPLTSTVTPIRVTGPGGATRELSRGFFAFAPAALDPSDDITVVFIGSAGESRCTLDRAQLKQLR